MATARAATRTDQRTGAGVPGSVDSPDLGIVVDVPARTDVVAPMEARGAVVTPPGAGTLCAGMAEVGGGAGLLPDEHDVTAAASARPASPLRLDDRVTAEFPQAAGQPGPDSEG